MGTVSLRLNSRDDALIRKYAELNNIDLSTFIRQAVIEKIEDEYDLELFDKVWELEKDGERFSHEEVLKKLGLWSGRYSIQSQHLSSSRKLIKNSCFHCENPRIHGKRLQGNLNDKWRYRAYDYRILAKIEDEEVLILIIEIGHRKDIYRWR